VATYLGTQPVRLFKHRRTEHHDALSSRAPGPDTEVSYPNTLHDVDHWLSDVVATAQKPPSDQSSTICLLFMDEDKCKRSFHDFSLDRIYAHLKITQWRPPHFQVTFLRFAIPLDVGIGKDHGSAKLSKHHNWDWRFGIRYEDLIRDRMILTSLAVIPSPGTYYGHTFLSVERQSASYALGSRAIMPISWISSPW
jgi:hypothetical protein